MTSQRINIPKAAHDRVLKEYDYRCAICEAGKPEVYHIDDDMPGDDLNLLPLCSKCHERFASRSSDAVEMYKLKLFRKYKQQLILHSLFHLIFKRLIFLDGIDADIEWEYMQSKIGELIRIVSIQERGDFYAKEISRLVAFRPFVASYSVSLFDDSVPEWYAEAKKKEKPKHIEQVRQSKEQICDLIIEMLTLQALPSQTISNTMPNSNEIRSQISLLGDHRERLATHLRQLAMTGFANTRPEVVSGIRDARANIQRIKLILREWGHNVDDHPDDKDENLADRIKEDDSKVNYVEGTVRKDIISAMINETKSWSTRVETWVAKLKLLSTPERDSILKVLGDDLANDRSAEFLFIAINALYKDLDMTKIVEYALEIIALSGNVKSKAGFMSSVSSNALVQTREDLRLVYFQDIIDIINRNEFREVNLITPAVLKVRNAIPSKLEKSFLQAVLKQAGSDAYLGSPAAKEFLQSISSHEVNIILDDLDVETLLWNTNRHLKNFISIHKHHWPEKNREIFVDFTEMEFDDFRKRYDPNFEEY